MSRSKEGFILGKNDRIQLAREIIARVKREMQLPRLTESVGNGFDTRPHQPRRSLLPVRSEGD